MATYKVIQDIEAEDKLVGPLTLRQFIYAGIAAVCLYICFLAYSRGAAFLIVFFLPIAAAAGFFAFPWKNEQPTEIWALARVRFSIKPRVRIWDQDGMKDLVTITAPKRIESRRSTKDNLTQDQVRSRLKALADTIDSRGWATRNAAYGIYNQQWNHPTVAPVPVADNNMSAMVPNDDMFANSSTVAQNFDAMLNKSQEQQRQRVMQQMAQAQNPQANDPYQMPQLPRPLNVGAMPDIPTPAPASAYDVAPASVPMPAHNTHYQAMPAPQQGYALPNMPAPQTQAPMPGPAPQTFSSPANGAWFANGPAYPTNPAPAPSLNTQPNPAGIPAGSSTPQPPFDPRIESDTPLAVAATPTNEETVMGNTIKQQNEAAMAINYNHMRVLQPTGNNSNDHYASDLPVIDFGTPPPAATSTTSGDSNSVDKPVTHTPNPVTLELANNDDLDIATIARQAKREIDKSPDEVEIRLH